MDDQRHSTCTQGATLDGKGWGSSMNGLSGLRAFSSTSTPTVVLCFTMLESIFVPAAGEETPSLSRPFQATHYRTPFEQQIDKPHGHCLDGVFNEYWIACKNGMLCMIHCPASN